MNPQSLIGHLRNGPMLSFLLDKAFGSTRGSILYRGANLWTPLTPGTSGYFLKTLGTGADPTWGDATGKLKQVVLADSDTQTSTTSTSYVASSLSASITPTASTSSILVIATALFAHNAGATYEEGVVRIYRDINGGGYSGVGQEFGMQGNTTNSMGWGVVAIAYDAPATTQVCTYKPYVKSDGGGSVIYNYNAATGIGGTIVLIEIGA